MVFISTATELVFACVIISASMFGLGRAPGCTPSLTPAHISTLSVLKDPIPAPNGSSTPDIKIEEELVVKWVRVRGVHARYMER